MAIVRMANKREEIPAGPPTLWMSATAGDQQWIRKKGRGGLQNE